MPKNKASTKKTSKGKKLLLALLGIFLLAAGVYYGIYQPSLRYLLFGEPQVVVLHTNMGDIAIQLYHDKAPKAAENFWRLAASGKYDNTIFHRVIPGFMIQGGDYEFGNGTGGKSIWGGYFEDEIAPELSHVRGAVSMANRGPNTNGSQFFIVQQDASYLDGKHTIFGQVLSGMEVVDAIAALPTNMENRPLQPAIIKNISFR